MTYHITNSGQHINLSNFTEYDLDIKDIAHHLTKICRYGGALPFDVHYSVAQHSLYLMEYVKKTYGNSDALQKAALLHDAAEAYIGDVVHSLKQLLPDYKNIEKGIENSIAKRWGVRQMELLVVKQLDKRIVLDEAEQLFPLYIDSFQPGKKLGIEIKPEKNFNTVYHLFLYHCNRLGVR